MAKEKTPCFIPYIIISQNEENPARSRSRHIWKRKKSLSIRCCRLYVPKQNQTIYSVTDKSFYNYGEFDLVNTGIILEDYDGLSEEAELAWRELQSNEKLSVA
ncbi:hypothetical protein E5F92_000220 [Flavobacterium columnare]|uniref:hypothetical protein n=1 Tax=Flavobacterium columnare TaxID=996 RepID=UPI002989CE2B|nr:hypothetical protein [Flavobacterium columnare]MCH4831182.1 hypothetical protein [Flavobacterium columnare]